MARWWGGGGAGHGEGKADSGRIAICSLRHPETLSQQHRIWSGQLLEPSKFALGTCSVGKPASTLWELCLSGSKARLTSSET